MDDGRMSTVLGSQLRQLNRKRCRSDSTEVPSDKLCGDSKDFPKDQILDSKGFVKNNQKKRRPSHEATSVNISGNSKDFHKDQLLNTRGFVKKRRHESPELTSDKGESGDTKNILNDQFVDNKGSIENVKKKEHNPPEVTADKISGDTGVFPKDQLLDNKESVINSNKAINNNDQGHRSSRTKSRNQPKQVSRKGRMPSPPDIIRGNTSGHSRVFRKDQLLGTGGFARVYQVTDTATGAKYADKVIYKMIFAKKDDARLKIEREIDIHKLLSHDNIVQFYDNFEDQDYMNLLLELCPQKTLLHVSKYRRTITENEVRFYTKQILEGVGFIHSKKILHRDLKLGNMFLSASMQVKIGDFGLATRFADNKPGNLCGTPNYIAPEVLAKFGHSVASEVWSIGCMVFALLAGTPPFETESVSSTYNLINKGIYNLPPTLSLGAKEFVKAMLCQDPKNRGHISPDPIFGSKSPSLKEHFFMASGQMPRSLPCSALSDCPPFLNSGLSKSRASPNLEIINAPAPPGGILEHCSPHMPKVKFLDNVLSCLVNCLSSSVDEKKESKLVNLTPVFVSKWVDYSRTYGYGYKMTDGGIGVRFVDNTTMATGDKKYIEFVDKMGTTFKFTKQTVNQKYPNLTKRVDTMFYFDQYMEEKLADASGSGQIIDHVEAGGPVPHLLHWTRSSTYVCMEFDTDLIQVNSLSDHWKLVLWQSQGILHVTCVLHGEIVTSSLFDYCPPSQREKLISAMKELKIMAANRSHVAT